VLVQEEHGLATAFLLAPRVGDALGPHAPNAIDLSQALGLVVVATGAWEFMLRDAGLGPEYADNRALWLSARQRLSQLDESAIALVGASRMQRAIDVDTLSLELDRAVVQLAVEGTSAIPMLAVSSIAATAPRGAAMPPARGAGAACIGGGGAPSPRAFFLARAIFRGAATVRLDSSRRARLTVRGW